MNLLNTSYPSTKFHHPMVRHLAWCMFSPDLAHLSAYPALKTESSRLTVQWLQDLDDNPTELEKYVQSHNHQLLGSYFECLWQFFFFHHPNWTLIRDHFQVSDQQGSKQPQTLGELDILAQDSTERDWHIELAVKFFLQLPDSSGEALEHWVGPQTRDRLDLKLSKLQNKQFPFLLHPQTQQALIEEQLTTQWQQALILKGYLFHHRTQETNLPKEVSEDLPIQYWCHSHEIGLSIPRHSYFVLLPKHEWLGPYAGLHIDVWDFDTTIENVKQHFAQPKPNYALMLAHVEKHKDNWIEKHRWMVVHDDWPNK